MRRTASADAVFKAFDDKISGYLDKNRASIEKELRMRAGRGVSDADVEAFMAGLGDAIYDAVEPDSAHLNRFVDFYVSDDKLSGVISDMIEKSSQYPRAASGPSEVASALRAISSCLSRKRPVAASVGAGLRRILVSISDR